MGSTRGSRRSVRDTVDWETPASRAMSWLVVFLMLADNGFPDADLGIDLTRLEASIIVEDYVVMSESYAFDLQDYARREMSEDVAEVIDAVRRRRDEAVADLAGRAHASSPTEFRVGADEVR